MKKSSNGKTDESVKPPVGDNAHCKIAEESCEEAAPLKSGHTQHLLTARLDNPFYLMRMTFPAHAWTLPVEKLENLLSQETRYIRPISINDILENQDASPIEVLQNLRTGLHWANEQSEKSAAEALCQITFILVERLNRLAENRTLGDAPSKIPKWPINFAPGTSEGASKLKEEVALFEGLKVGTQSFITANPKSRAGMPKHGKGGWRLETEAAVEAARTNANWIASFLKIKDSSKRIQTFEYYHTEMKKKFRVTGYRTPNGRTMLWPWWMEDLLPLAQMNSSTGENYFERLDEISVEYFLPVVEGLILWRSIFEECTEKLQRKVVDEDEGGEEMAVFQPELFGKILKGVRNTLLALAGKPRRKNTS